MIKTLSKLGIEDAFLNTSRQYTKKKKKRLHLAPALTAIVEHHATETALGQVGANRHWTILGLADGK